jgi:hypothetical protein
MHASDNTTEGSQDSSVSVVSGQGVSNKQPASSFYMVLSLILLEVWNVAWYGVEFWFKTVSVTGLKAGKGMLFQYGPGVDSASNRNEYQEYFLGLKVVGV